MPCPSWRHREWFSALNKSIIQAVIQHNTTQLYRTSQCWYMYCHTIFRWKYNVDVGIQCLNVSNQNWTICIQLIVNICYFNGHPMMPVTKLISGLFVFLSFYHFILVLLQNYFLLVYDLTILYNSTIKLFYNDSHFYVVFPTIKLTGQQRNMRYSNVCSIHIYFS